MFLLRIKWADIIKSGQNDIRRRRWSRTASRWLSEGVGTIGTSGQDHCGRKESERFRSVSQSLSAHSTTY